MKIDYTTCDICGKKIDPTKTDDVLGEIKILITKKMRIAGEKKEKKGPVLFTTEKIADLPKTMEYVERVTIDLCADHAKDVLTYVTNARKAKDKAKRKK